MTFLHQSSPGMVFDLIEDQKDGWAVFRETSGKRKYHESQQWETRLWGEMLTECFQRIEWCPIFKHPVIRK